MASVPPSFASFPDLPSNSAPAPPKHKERERKRKHKDIPRPEKHKDRPKAKSNDEPRDSGSRFYYSDRKGDPLNIQYGGMHSRDVPKYRTGRHVLGLPPSFSAFRTSHGIEVGPPGKRKMPSLTDASSRALLSRQPTRSLVNATASSSSKYEEHDGFLRLPSRTVHEQSYRSIENTNPNSDSESESGAGESDIGESSEDDAAPDSHTATHRSLNERLTADPRSISNWLSLLSHTLLTTPTTSKNATRARSEISISILARAIAVDGNGNSYLLRVKYLQAGEEVWHESKLRAEWEDALRKVKGVEIWMEWFEWRIRNGTNGISTVVEDAKRALAAVRDEVGQVRIFWRLAVAFQSAGFGERATAMFQAQAELTFQIPQALYGLPLQHRLDSLEEFWESECPRLGEVGAQGWDSWYSSGRPSVPPPAQPSPSLVDDLDPYRKFGFSEALADRTLFLPRRSTESEADSDPYSTILFSDIRDVLLHLDSSSAKDVLRYAWLTVLGLHLPGLKAAAAADADADGMDWDDRWCHAYLTRPAFLEALFPKAPSSRIVNDAVAGVIIGREREYTSGLGNPVLSWGWGVIGPLEVPSSHGKTRGLWNKEDLDGVDVAFVRNIFEQLRLGNDDVHWDLLTLAFAAASSVKGALKLSRAFLSTAPDSLFHWAAHARLEQLRGRLDDARKVYETVLSTPSPPTRPGIGQLWWDWAQLEWLAGAADAALKVILRSGGVQGSGGGVVLLRAKRNLDDNAVAVGADAQAREGWVKLRALMELLTSNGVEQALRVFDEHGAQAQERLLVGELLMLYRHGTILRNPTPPAVLRERVEKAITLYPSNSVVLGLFLEAEKGQGVWGKVRTLLGEGASVEKDVLRRVEEVWVAGWDKSRWEAEVERTRSGLAAAVDSERTRRSATLWRIFIEFEIRVGQLNRAKKLLYRAIGDCPLAKELYLVAFGALRGVFSGPELNGIADTMAERGLRLRRGLDELVEGWEENNGSEMESEADNNGDEIERAAAEYRERLPY